MSLMVEEDALRDCRIWGLQRGRLMAEGKADGKVSDIKKERFDRQDRDRTRDRAIQAATFSVY